MSINRKLLHVFFLQPLAISSSSLASTSFFGGPFARVFTFNEENEVNDRNRENEMGNLPVLGFPRNLHPPA